MTTDLEADFAKVREFIEHEREMRECCTDLPDYMCAPTHAKAALDRIDDAYRSASDGEKACDECSLVTDNADLRHQLAKAQTQLGNLLAVIHRDGGHTQAKIGTSHACADATIQVTKWLSADDTITDLRRQLAALRAGYDSDGGHPMKETL